MNNNYFPIRLIRKSEDIWQETDIVLKEDFIQKERFWKKFSSKDFKNLPGLTNVLCVQSIENELSKNKLLLVFTKGFSGLYDHTIPEEWKGIVEIDEYIDASGEVKQSLDESEINNLLRMVYAFKPKLVIISLLNSIKNDVHERILKNILIVPGYKCRISSETLKKIAIE